MKQIIVINGEAGSGKDTFVWLCKNVDGIALKEGWNFSGICNFSMVDKVKQIAEECGWNGKKDSKSRKFLSDLKDLCDEYNQMSFRDLEHRVFTFRLDPYAKILFVHAREPKDIQAIVEKYKAKTLLIKRNGHSTEASNHADADVYNYEYDYVVTNPGDSIEEYQKQARDFLKAIGYFQEKDTNIA